MKKAKQIRSLTLAGVLTALVFIFTAYLHIPSHTGYTHVGDGFIYLAACLLPTPYAVFVGAIGALLADVLGGFAIWAPGSVVIKAAAVLFFSRKGKRILNRHNLLALLPAALICIGGYYFYEVLITGNLVSPLGGIAGYATQSVLSSVLFVFLALGLDKMKFNEKWEI